MKLCYEGARRSSDTTAVSDALARISTADPEGAANYLLEQAIEFFNNGQEADAVAALREVLKAKPNLGRAHYLLGMSYFNSGDADAAKSHLNTFLELDPEAEEAPLARDMLSFMR
ncbi:MAG: tetratricopeptide repeat protein [bacterium]|nr:tetratricopeptide repeat protein [bacterium]